MAFFAHQSPLPVFGLFPILKSIMRVYLAHGVVTAVPQIRAMRGLKPKQDNCVELTPWHALLASRGLQLRDSSESGTAVFNTPPNGFPCKVIWSL